LNPSIAKYGYQGSYAEEVTEFELNYNEFALRTYDPQIGRWLTPDPYNEFASPYVSMGGDPANFTDPSGGNIWGAFGAVNGTILSTVGGALVGVGIGMFTGNEAEGAAIGAALGLGIGLGFSMSTAQAGKALETVVNVAQTAPSVLASTPPPAVNPSQTGTPDYDGGETAQPSRRGGPNAEGCCPSGSPSQYLAKAAGDITTAMAGMVDNISSFFTSSDVEVTTATLNPNVSQVTTHSTTTTYSSNLKNWVLKSQVPGSTVNSSNPFYNANTSTSVKVETKHQVSVKKVNLEVKTATDGSSTSVKVEANTTVKKVPVKVSVQSTSTTNSSTVKVKVGTGTSTTQVFVQGEGSVTNGTVGGKLAIGVEQKAGNVKMTSKIGKSF
jgi:RHS repeat-associated protein